MIRKTIFISCGQFTDAEKRLGKQIAELVRKLTNLEPFFAEEVQDLNGLDANILNALRGCVAFITILHPRGEIKRPDGTVLVRGSLWIEQEIAIATYIQRAENRPLPIVAFKHKSVGLEGIRGLLHLNPVEFTDESEVLSELPNRLERWKSLRPTGIELLLRSTPMGQQEGHAIRRLEIGLANETNQPIEKYEFEIRLPSSILKHWNTTYPTEVPCNFPGLRCFRIDQDGRGVVRPHDQLRQPITFEYCTECAMPEYEERRIGAALVSETKIGARAWIAGNEYVAEKTIKELAVERSQIASSLSELGRRNWPSEAGAFSATSSETIPLFPSDLSGFRSEDGKDFWRKPFPLTGSMRVFQGKGWMGIPNFPCTMNGCSHGFFMIRWRTDSPDSPVQSSVRFSTNVSGRGDTKTGGFGYMSGTNCEQPMFNFGDVQLPSGATLVDVHYELKFWHAAP